MADFDVEVVQRLAASNFPPERIAHAMAVPVSVIIQTLRQTQLSPEDKELQTAIRGLAFKVVAEAEYILAYGHPTDRMSVIRSMLGRVGGMIGQESTSTFQESRQAVARIWERQREDIELTSPSLDPVPITTEDEYAPPTPSLARGTNNPRQEAPVDEDPVRSDIEPDWGDV